jgi:ABC-type oligopeptide transport system substrate-binding subunit
LGDKHSPLAEQPANWGADYPDPENFLNMLLESGSIIPTLVNPAYRAQQPSSVVRSDI